MRQALGIDLAARELIEQGGRSRTFLVRNVYAIGLFLTVLVFYATTYPSLVVQVSPLLGRGVLLFELLVRIQFGLIYAVAPMLFADAIARERGGSRWALLALAGVGPGGVLAGKLIARLAPVAVMLSLSLPFVVVAYVYGGVSRDLLGLAAALLALACLQVGAIGLFCGCVLRGPTATLTATYVLLALFAAAALGVSPPLAVGLAPALAFEHARDAVTFREGLSLMAPAGASVIVFLVGARTMLWLGRGELLGGTRRRRVSGPLARLPRADEPDDELAVFWRGTRRLGLSSRGGRLAWHVLAALAALATVWWVHGRALTSVSSVEWIVRVAVSVAVVMIVASVAGGIAAFSLERARGTLGPLLATPLSTESIARQKVGALRAHVGPLRTAVGVLLAGALWVQVSAGTLGGIQAVLCGVAMGIAVWIVDSIAVAVAWQATSRGMRAEARMKTLALCSMTLAAMLYLPSFLFLFVWLHQGVLHDERHREFRRWLRWIGFALVVVWLGFCFSGSSVTASLLLSGMLVSGPVGLFRTLDGFATGWATTLEFVQLASVMLLAGLLLALVAYSFRALCLELADEHLDRSEE